MIARSTTTLNQGQKYIQNLQTIVERYNESPHRALYNLSPYDVYKNGKIPNEFQNLKKRLNNSTPTTQLLKQGDIVRIARIKNNIFEKSIPRRWITEKFRIRKVYITDPVTYSIEDLKGEDFKGIFYRKELQKI